MEAANSQLNQHQFPPQESFLLPACDSCFQLQTIQWHCCFQIDDLKHCSFAEICWYFTESSEQFRISGSVDVIDGTNPDPVKLQRREKSWFACSLRSRLQYMAPTPRLPSLSEQPSQIPSLDPSVGPVAAFCLLVLNPDQVDYLNLKSNERVIFVGTECWWREAVDIRKCESLAFYDVRISYDGIDSYLPVIGV